MNNLSLNSKLTRNIDVAYTQIDNDLVIMEPEKHLFYGVNGVGMSIWNLLEFNTLSLGAICDHILEDYDVTSTQCLDDVTQFIEAMILHNLLFIKE